MADNDKSLITKTLHFLLRFSAAALAIIWLLHGKGGEIREHLCRFNILLLLPAFLFYALHIVVSAWRWRKLAEIVGVYMTMREAFSLTMQGCFFSLVIPGGAIGGDVVKAAVLSRKLSGGGRMEGIISILIDRVVGMCALFLLALILILPAGKWLMDSSWHGEAGASGGSWLFALLVIICVSGWLAGIALFFYRKFLRIPGITFLTDLIDRFSGNMCSRLFMAMDSCRSEWKKLLLWSIISVFGAHLMTVMPMFFLLDRPLDFMELWMTATALTVGNIAGLCPLFPGGIGSRDVVVVSLLGAAGLGTGAQTAQLLYTGVMVICFLAGGIFFIFDPGRKKVFSGGGL